MEEIRTKDAYKQMYKQRLKDLQIKIQLSQEANFGYPGVHVYIALTAGVHHSHPSIDTVDR